MLISRPLRLIARFLSSTPILNENLILNLSSVNEVLYDSTQILQADIPGSNGSFGILKNHVPIFGTLAAGKLTIHEMSGKKSFIVSGGVFMMSKTNLLTILCNHILDAEDFDVSKLSTVDFDKIIEKSLDSRTKSDVDSRRDALRIECQKIVDSLKQSSQ